MYVTKQHQDKTSSESLWCQRHHAVCGFLWLFSRQRARSLLVPPGPSWTSSSSPAPRVRWRLDQTSSAGSIGKSDPPPSSSPRRRPSCIFERVSRHEDETHQSERRRQEVPHFSKVGTQNTKDQAVTLWLCEEVQSVAVIRLLVSQGGRRQSSTSQCDLEPGAWNRRCPGTSRYVHGAAFFRALIRCRNGGDVSVTSGSPRHQLLFQ